MNHRHDIIAGIVLIAVGSVGIFQSSKLPAGAADFPLFVLIALIILAALMIGRGILTARNAAGDSEHTPFIVAPARLAIGVIAMSFYIAGIQFIGFYLTTAIFIPCTALALGLKRIKFIVMATIGFLAFVYVVFGIMLERVLPSGVAFLLLVGFLSSAGTVPYV
jgi:NADH:ubiquinone oxidoreductase subunit 3 (subunit A)